MSALSAGLINVENLQILGAQAGAIQATNLSFDNLSVSGTFRASLAAITDYQNLCQLQQFDVAEIYSQGEDAVYYNTPNAISVKPNVSITNIKLLDDSGNVTSFLTEATSHTNPVALNHYGKQAPLVKIDDSGILTYLDVSGTSITDICQSLVPDNLTNFKFALQTKDQTWPMYDDDEGILTYGHKDITDDTVQYLSHLIKRGFPMPDTNGVKNYNMSHVFYQSMLMEVKIYSSDLFGENNMTIGLDINPYLTGSGTMNFFIQGGFMRTVPLQLGTVDWSNTTTIPPMSLNVTTDAMEYMVKKQSGLNSIYLNTNLNVLNMHIVDFDGYTSSWPDSNVGSTTNITCSPVSFECTFGFFRNQISTTTSGNEDLPHINDTNITVDQYYGTKPVQSSLVSAEYMVQISEQLVFTYNLSNSEELQTTTIDRMSITEDHRWHEGLTRELCTTFFMPRYDLGLDTNFTMQFMPGTGCEEAGFPFTRGSVVGDNRNTPYLTEINAKSGRFLAGFGRHQTPDIAHLDYFDLSKGPDAQSSLVSNSIVQHHCSYLDDFHEFTHLVGFGVGLNSADTENMIYDDEWLTSALTSYSTSVFLDKNDRPMNLVHGYQACKLFITAFRMSRGVTVPFSCVVDSATPLLTSGTDFKNYNAFFQTSMNYYVGSLSSLIKYSYDPNDQHLKLFIYYMSKKLSGMSNRDTLSLYSLNKDRSSNPSITMSAWKEAVEGAHMRYSDDSLITDAATLHLETLISYFMLRNNTSIPDKYKSHFAPNWYVSRYSPNSKYYVADNTGNSDELNMASWDFMQTNEDTIGNVSEGLRYDPAIPWWPRVISPAGPDCYGRLVGHGTDGAMTTDCTYKATCTSTSPFVSSVTRHLWSFQSAAYAFSNQQTSVTVSLAEPTEGGSYGDYNQNIQVAIFKYIPDSCVSGVAGSTGAFIMKGPYTLSQGGVTTKTFDLTDTMVNDAHPGYIVNNNSSNITSGMLSFNHTFPKSIDDTTVYDPPTHSITRATALGMTQGVYQPVTKLVILNGQIDTVNLDDTDILDKLFLDQIKPSCITISAV